LTGGGRTGIIEPREGGYVSRERDVVEPAVAIAAELGMTANAVRTAKCRVLSRLREELGDLIQ
jgi:hypothetical protein